MQAASFGIWTWQTKSTFYNDDQACASISFMVVMVTTKITLTELKLSNVLSAQNFGII